MTRVLFATAELLVHTRLKTKPTFSTNPSYLNGLLLPIGLPSR